MAQTDSFLHQTYRLQQLFFVAWPTNTGLQAITKIKIGGANYTIEGDSAVSGYYLSSAALQGKLQYSSD